MRINAFTCCVNYEDILSLIHTHNRPLFNSFTVITSTTDIATQEVCKKNGIDFLTSDSYLKNNSKFNKAAMLNELLDYVCNKYQTPDDWYLSMDCDIIVKTSLDFESITLDENCVYGSKRIIIEDIKKFKDTQDFSNGYFQFKRWSYPFAQMGYFQLFKKYRVKFDEKYQTASHCDTDFFIDNWNRQYAIDFNENYLVCYHLGCIEKNWAGRITEKL